MLFFITGSAEQDYQGFKLNLSQYNYQDMATQLSRNNSHRRLIKEKTNQLVDFRRLAPKSTIQIKSVPITNQSENKNHLPSHDHDHDELNTSFQMRLKKQAPTQLQALGKPAYFIRKRNCSNSKSKANGFRYRSVEPIAPGQINKSPRIRANFSVRRMSIEASKRQISSMENLESRISVKKKQGNDYLKPRSENFLKQTLKKTSSKQLKIKVKDPFEKRKKLDNEFADTSIIERVEGDESIMLSTVNQEQFKELLSKIL